MSLTLLKIWGFSNEVAVASLQQLLDNGYKIRTESENVHIKIISGLSGHKNSFLPELDNEILADKFFVRRLEKAENDGLEHDDILIKALQESDNADLKRILELQEKARLEAEDRKRQTLLENTYDEKPEDICPLNPHEESNFYYIDPSTGDKVLLEPHRIFQYREYCYDIDTVFRYINLGGHVHLDADYIKRFFNKNGSVDFSGTGLTAQGLRKKTYHEGVRVLHLDNNSISSLRDTHLPLTLQILTINNNPLKGGYFLSNETPKLLILSMEDCGLDKVDCEYLPQSLQILNISKNKNLIEIHSLKNMRNLKRLDIRKTGIKKIDWSKFVTVDPKKKLTLYCDEDVKFKKEKPDWIVVKHVD